MRSISSFAKEIHGADAGSKPAFDKAVEGRYRPLGIDSGGEAQGAGWASMRGDGQRLSDIRASSKRRYRGFDFSL
ncbi:hypothetical protein RDV64_01525 [Acuticoccus sp. MNP-M23]|uniref:hypothetical protein n=1 Tax=Acuticoccus sp. MNP-M23 TaxID=3072793 RepID=UPI0028158FA1|nr:hypothetical protein [Acuticoccus sp. MNP-M23]WMS43112.1 hypothetical protein RDV64_01525 [Acuticoccus sp. MNP-M23]